MGGLNAAKKHCVLGATANERPPALRVVVPVKKPSLVFHSVTAKNAAELADTAAMFVVVRAKSNLEIPDGNQGRRIQQIWQTNRRKKRSLRGPSSQG